MKSTLYCGDCLELMNRIPDSSIDMVLSDLPYGTTRCRWDTPINLQELWKQYRRVVKENGAIVLFSAQPFTTELISSNKAMYRYEWIWRKTQPSGFMNAKKMPLRTHENIEIFYRKPPTYNPQMTHGHQRKNGDGIRNQGIGRQQLLWPGGKKLYIRLHRPVSGGCAAIQHRGQGQAPAPNTEARGPAGIPGQDLHEPRRDSPGQLHGSWKHRRCLHEYWAGICRDRAGSGILPAGERKD